MRAVSSCSSVGACPTGRAEVREGVVVTDDELAVDGGDDSEVMRYCDRMIGRWQRHVRWAVFGNVIFPDWREVKSGYARGVMPETPVTRPA